MKSYKIKKRDYRIPLYIPNPMITSFKKPKIPLALLKAKNPIKTVKNTGFVIEGD